jgi:hypothetical protein
MHREKREAKGKKTTREEERKNAIKEPCKEDKINCKKETM